MGKNTDCGVHIDKLIARKLDFANINKELTYRFRFRKCLPKLFPQSAISDPKLSVQLIRGTGIYSYSSPAASQSSRCQATRPSAAENRSVAPLIVCTTSGLRIFRMVKFPGQHCPTAECQCPVTAKRGISACAVMCPKIRWMTAMNNRLIPVRSQLPSTLT